MTDIHIEPGSPAEAAVRFLRDNPDELLDRAAASAKLSLPPVAIERALQPAVDQGLITLANNGEYGRIWRAGPRLKHWAPPGAGPATDAASPQPPKAEKKASARVGKRNRLPVLDVTSFPVRKDMPVPMPAMSRPGQTRYDAMFSDLTADGMARVGLPLQYRGALTKAGQTYLKNRPELSRISTFLFRGDPDGKTFGIWRVARTDTGAIKTTGNAKAREALKAA